MGPQISSRNEPGAVLEEQLCHLPLLFLQEAREGYPVFDRARFPVRHSCGGGSLHPGAERPEPADDRGISGEPAEAVQQRCVGVRTPTWGRRARDSWKRKAGGRKGAVHVFSSDKLFKTR